MRRLLDGRSRLQFPPPMWKVEREFIRVGRQLEDILLRATGFSISKYYLKRFIDPKVTTSPGALTLRDRAAIYMIFPAEGLLASHVMALDYIIACGYVPIVVSNLPLDQTAQATLLQRSAALIQRPNFGYDFAAYRDGLIYLDTVGARPEYLAIFNDSTWFPAYPERNWLQEAEATGCDYVGSVFHCAMSPDIERDFRSEPWLTAVTFPHFHYGSFALLIRGKVLQSPEFQQFWRDYIASNDKAKTIIRGEIGLSHLIIKTGFSHAATLDNHHLPDILRALPVNQLREIAENTMTPMYPGLRKARLAVLAQTPPDPTVLLDFILKSVVKQGPAYAQAYFDVQVRNGNFIKKSSVSLDKTSADITLHLLSLLPDAQARMFGQEARAMYAIKHGNPPV